MEGAVVEHDFPSLGPRRRVSNARRIIKPAAGKSIAACSKQLGEFDAERSLIIASGDTELILPAMATIEPLEVP